jgi:hypothetical protein
MIPAFVIGNGISRKDIDLDLLRGKGITYGCNALYRDFTPDVLVAFDLLISKEICGTKYALKNTLYTTNPRTGSGALDLKDELRSSAGITALHLASISGKHDTIYLLGFDLGSIGKKPNNCYFKTSCYLKKHPYTVELVRSLKTQLVHSIEKEHAKCNVKYVRVVNDCSVD